MPPFRISLPFLKRFFGLEIHEVCHVICDQNFGCKIMNLRVHRRLKIPRMVWFCSMPSKIDHLGQSYVHYILQDPLKTSTSWDIISLSLNAIQLQWEEEKKKEEQKIKKFAYS